MNVRATSVVSMRVLMVIALAATASQLLASDSSDDLSAVQEFVEHKLIGKTTEAKSVHRITGSPVETEFLRRTYYQNPSRTREAFSFDAILLIKQSNYDLDGDGTRLTERCAVK